MISRKQWIVLFLVYLVYLLVGAIVFLHLEADYEMRNLLELRALQRKLSALVYLTKNESEKNIFESTLKGLERYLGETLLLPELYTTSPLLDFSDSFPIQISNYTANGSTLVTMREEIYEAYNESRPKEVLEERFSDATTDLEAMWNLWNSFFFSFTAVTTIGFGHMSPSTEGGQLFCILYSLFGVPLNGIVFAGLGDLFSSKIISKIESGRYKKKLTVVLDSCFYLLPGLVVLMVFPAVIIMYIEQWSFLEAFYFAFITLSTIGFGDYVAGYPNSINGYWVWVYRILIMAWICFGLGYLLMVITFIQRALRSEEVRKLDRTVKRAFHHRVVTTSSNLRKDLDRLKEILQAISILKIKDKDVELDTDIEDESEPEEELEDEEAAERYDGFPRSSIGNTPFPIRKRTSSIHNTRRRPSNVDILLHLAESVIQHDDEKGASPVKTDNQFKGTYNTGGEDASIDFDDLPQPPHPIMRRLSKSFGTFMGGTSKLILPTQDKDPERIHTLGDILEKVEEIIHKNRSDSTSLDLSDVFALNKDNNALKRSHSTSSLQKETLAKFSEPDYPGESPERRVKFKSARRYTLSSLTTR